MLRRTLSQRTSSNAPQLVAPSPLLKLPLFGHAGYAILHGGNIMSAFDYLHDTYGPVFQFKVPGDFFVLIGDAPLIQHIMATQGPTAHRPDGWHWCQIFDENDWPRDIVNARGERWKAYRHVLNKTLQQQSSSAVHLGNIFHSADRLVQAIAFATDPATGKLKAGVTMRQLFSLYALEAMVEAMLGIREAFLNTGDNQKPTIVSEQEAIQFAEDMEMMFSLTDNVDNDPFARLMPHYNKNFLNLKEAWERIAKTGEKIVLPTLRKYAAAAEAGKYSSGGEGNGAILHQLIAQMKQQPEAGAEGGTGAAAIPPLSEKEAMWIALESCAAAVDTTSQTLEFLMGNLGRHPASQQKLFEEVVQEKGLVSAVASSSPPPSSARNKSNSNKSNKDLFKVFNQCSWLRSCMKESMRLHPTVPMHIRTLQQDLVNVPVVDHSIPEEESSKKQQQTVTIPKGTNVLLNWYRASRVSGHYAPGSAAPTAFDPTRFAREEAATKNCPAAAVGVGVQQGEKASPSSSSLASRGCPVGKQLHPATHLPFGHGVRRCPGAGFAQLLVQAGLAQVVAAYNVQYSGAEIQIHLKALTRPAEPMSPHVSFVRR